MGVVHILLVCLTAAAAKKCTDAPGTTQPPVPDTQSPHPTFGPETWGTESPQPTFGPETWGTESPQPTFGPETWGTESPQPTFGPETWGTQSPQPTFGPETWGTESPQPTFGPETWGTESPQPSTFQPVTGQPTGGPQSPTYPPYTTWAPYTTYPPYTPYPSTEYPTDPPGPAPTSWPYGKYGLVRAGAECPDGGNFREGYRYFDTEDDNNQNMWDKWSPGIGAYFKHDGFKLNFCMKESRAQSYNWPEGSYCILKKKNVCPWNGRRQDNPWQSGSITWADETDNNANRKSGKLPKGLWKNNSTKINFCCRDDGPAGRPIQLPISKPFYLFNYKDRCQRVAQMMETPEFVRWDTENTGTNSHSGAVPREQGNVGDDYTDIFLTFCLYQPYS